MNLMTKEDQEVKDYLKKLVIEEKIPVECYSNLSELIIKYKNTIKYFSGVKREDIKKILNMEL